MTYFMLQSLFITFLESLLGLLLAFTLAFPTVFLIDYFKSLKLILEPIFVLYQAIPFLVLAPFLVLIFGFGFFTKVLVVAFVSFFAIVVSALNRLSTCPKNYLLLFKSLGASNFQILYKLKIIYSLPAFASGFKIASSYAVSCAVMAESLGSQFGMGVVLMQARKAYNYHIIYLAVALIIALSLFFYFVSYYIEKKLLKNWGEM